MSAQGGSILGDKKMFRHVKKKEHTENHFCCAICSETKPVVKKISKFGMLPVRAGYKNLLKAISFQDNVVFQFDDKGNIIDTNFKMSQQAIQPKAKQVTIPVMPEIKNEPTQYDNMPMNPFDSDPCFPDPEYTPNAFDMYSPFDEPSTGDKDTQNNSQDKGNSFETKTTDNGFDPNWFFF